MVGLVQGEPKVSGATELREEGEDGRDCSMEKAGVREGRKAPTVWRTPKGAVYEWGFRCVDVKKEVNSPTELTWTRPAPGRSARPYPNWTKPTEVKIRGAQRGP